MASTRASGAQPWYRIIIHSMCRVAVQQYKRINGTNKYRLGEDSIKISGFRINSESASCWWRGQDSNLRPLGYEPNELPLLHPAMFRFRGAKVGTFLFPAKYLHKKY